jgi:hypothetical protein
MSIRLEGQPSTDGLGVKRWTYNLDHGHVLHVFERPSDTCQPAHKFMLRLMERDGSFLSVSFVPRKDTAAQLARYIDRDVREGDHDESYQLIIRAIHERGIRQKLALRAIERRGLWLSEDQKRQAGVP